MWSASKKKRVFVCVEHDLRGRPRACDKTGRAEASDKDSGRPLSPLAVSSLRICPLRSVQLPVGPDSRGQQARAPLRQRTASRHASGCGCARRTVKTVVVCCGIGCPSRRWSGSRSGHWRRCWHRLASVSDSRLLPFLSLRPCVCVCARCVCLMCFFSNKTATECFFVVHGALFST